MSNDFVRLTGNRGGNTPKNMIKKLRWYFIKRKHHIIEETELTPEENIVKVKIDHQYNPEVERKNYINSLIKQQSNKFNL